MAIPYPGAAVRGSTTGKPIMALLDLLGRTWALGVIWHLSEAPATFRQLQQRGENISPSLLNTRLKELRALGLIQSDDSGYYLSDQGRELFDIIAPLGPWARQWASQLPNAEDLP